jgi:uncharacterized protein YmfQ (DUF2313 family)
MARTALQYKQLIKGLFPRGRAWNKELDSVLDQYCYALAEEFTRIEGRQIDLKREGHVIYASELLDEYETDYGINNSSLSDAERQQILHTMLLSTGGLYPTYYIEVLAALGYTITITEYTPAWVNVATIGDTVGDQSIIFIFTANVDIDGDEGEFDIGFTTDFNMRPTNDITVYQSRVRTLDPVIETFRPIKPSHMHDQYAFLNAAFDHGFDWSFEAFPSNDDSIPIPQFNSGFNTDFAAHHTYDGTYLTGPYDQAFNSAFDTHHGGAFQNDIFSTDFIRPV